MASENGSGGISDLLSAWFGLTLSERRVVCLILFLALLGLLGRSCHLKSEQAKPYVPDRPAVQFRHPHRQPAAAAAGTNHDQNAGPALAPDEIPARRQATNKEEHSR